MKIHLAYLLELVQTCSGVSGKNRIPARLPSWFVMRGTGGAAEMGTGRVTCVNSKFGGQQCPFIFSAREIIKEQRWDRICIPKITGMCTLLSNFSTRT